MFGLRLRFCRSLGVLMSSKYHENSILNNAHVHHQSAKYEQIVHHDFKLTGLAPTLGTFGSDQAATDYIECVSLKRLDMFKSDFDNGRGLFITIKDKGNIATLLRNWPNKDIRAICVTDGERILGLGDQGAFGMGIPVGKLALYTGLAGIPPQHLLPVCLDVGTNNEKHLSDPIYFGLKQKRVTGDEYDEFIDEFMTACVDVFNRQVLIQFEDFANHNAFRLLQKYAPHYCTFNDDIQGTASVVLAALLASLKVTGRKLTEEKIVCYGAGEANLGFAHLVCLALNKTYGLTIEEARKNIYLIDSKGLVVDGRKSGGINSQKLEFARPPGTPELTSLEEIITFSKCTSLIGAAAIPNVFNERILNLMAEMNEKPVIMALSNPTTKAECTAEEAYRHTHGRCVFASGSPFLPLTMTPQQCPELKESISRCPGQANNSYIFPGVALAIVSGQIFPVTNEDFLVASETLANLVTESDYSVGRLFPPLSDIKRVSSEMAMKIVKNASSQGRCRVLKLNTIMDNSTIEELISNFSYYPQIE
ncbi:unnamed protein product [Heterobilharzia americana]|nr:unnamed protein product [Heterobilharzia americana]